MFFNTIEEILEDLQKGKIIIVVDDKNRENEGDLIMAAEKVTPEAVNFMITYGKGLVCVPMQNSELTRLKLPLMVINNRDAFGTAFTISVDHKNTTTGISANERALTIKELVNPKNTFTDFNIPGHIFPICAKEGGVLERAGHTEAAVDLAKLAGLKPAAVICEIIQEDGTMARLPQLEIFTRKWDMKLVSIKDIIKYKKQINISSISKVKLPTKYGSFNLIAYKAYDSNETHLVLIKGDISNSKEPVLTRIHSECITGDLFGSKRCDCGSQLQSALRKIEEAGKGILIYLRQEGRGIGLLNKLKAYKLQEQGYDTVESNLKLGFEPELRNFKIAAQILKELKVTKVRLMTNNPLKISDLKKNGIKIIHREAIEIKPNKANKFYLQTKKEKMGHMLERLTS